MDLSKLGQLVQDLQTAGSTFADPNDVSALEIYKLTDDPFAETHQRVVARLLETANQVLQLLSTTNQTLCERNVRKLDISPSSFENVMDSLEMVTEIIDDALESVGYFVDRASKGPMPINSIQTHPIVSTFPKKEGQSPEIQLIHAQNVQRPQLKFQDPVDNSDTPFVHKLAFKPNAMVPLDRFSPHPYEHEIRNTAYPHRLFELSKPAEILDYNSTPYQWIETEADLALLAEILDRVEEMAVDLEHHSYRSYQGFCCLMQISTRTHDFVIDTLQLRHAMNILNSSFTNQQITKVFHGSAHDILWMQRDFGLYVVNLFDTFVASKLLSLSSHSLAFLLDRYVGEKTDKTHQLADWRIRPLPPAMIKYARKDTHYLLHIFDVMKNELLAISDTLLHQVLIKSSEMALKVYRKPQGWSEELQAALLVRSGKNLDERQQAVLKEMWIWRDTTARMEDESTGYVLPNALLMTLAEKMPTSCELVLACGSMPPLVLQHLTDIVLVISRAKLPAIDKDQNTKPKSLLASILRGHPTLRDQTLEPIRNAFGYQGFETSDLTRPTSSKIQNDSNYHVSEALIRPRSAKSNKLLPRSRIKRPIQPEESEIESTNGSFPLVVWDRPLPSFHPSEQGKIFDPYKQIASKRFKTDSKPLTDRGQSLVFRPTTK